VRPTPAAGVRVICVTPSHQSPTGVALSIAARRRLLDYARRTTRW
jgi:GntR family transcriptional regulator/MocR family aminotransferase